MSSEGGNTHWCYQCRQPIRLRGRAMVCSLCEGGFVQELEEIGGGRNGGGGGSVQFSGIMDALDSLMLMNSPDHRFGLIESLDSLLTERRRHGVESDPRTNNPDPIFALLETLEVFQTNLRRRIRSGVDSDHPRSPTPRLIYQGQMPPPRSRRGFETLFNRGNNDGFFVGPGLEDLMDQLMTTSRRGPPRAPQSEIDALPTIKEPIFKPTHIARFAKTRSRWARKLGLCHANIFITPVALSRGWFSITRALFAGMFWAHPRLTLTQTCAPGVRVRVHQVAILEEGGTLGLSSGLFAHRLRLIHVSVPKPVVETRQPQPQRQQQLMERITRRTTRAGPLITR